MTITGHNVSINDFTIINSGINGSGIFISSSSHTNLYRCNIVRNKGNGITLEKSTNCVIENCIISFNNNHGIFLNNSDSNIIECSFISYNINNAGISLLNANHNQIKGKKNIQQNPIQFYISTLYQKTNYNLSNTTQLISFSKTFLNLFINDFLEQLYYFPSNPPTQEGHILSTEYLHIVKNKIGILLEKCSNNIIQQTWIQENEKGIINRNTSDEINPMIFNFISGNNIGVAWDNASLDGFELNNICYNKKKHNHICINHRQLSIL